MSIIICPSITNKEGRIYFNVKSFLCTENGLYLLMSHSGAIYKYWCKNMFVLKEIQICLGKDHTYSEYLFREVNVSEEPLFPNN